VCVCVCTRACKLPKYLAVLGIASNARAHTRKDKTGKIEIEYTLARWGPGISSWGPGKPFLAQALFSSKEKRFPVQMGPNAQQ